MHPALAKLMFLRIRGGLRRIGRSLRTFRGALYFAFGVALCIFWVGSSAFALLARDYGATKHVAGSGPLAMLILCALQILTSRSEHAIPFTPAEIDFLFPGPFTRRQLLLYSIVWRSLPLLISSVFITAIGVGYGGWWPAVYFGSLLLFLFLHLFSICIVLIRQTMAQSVFIGIQRVLLLAVLVLAMVGLRRTLTSPLVEDFAQMRDAMLALPGMPILLAPFKVLVGAVSATTWLDLLAWGAGALVLDAALLSVVIALDANYLEASVGAGQRQMELLSRIQRKGLVGWVGSVRSRRRIRMLPHWNGAGPLLWRQVVTAARTMFWMLAGILLTSVVGAAALALMPQTSQTVFAGVAMGSVACFYSSIFLPVTLRFDFRGDLDQMAWLKTLPIVPWAMALGELSAMVIFLSLAQTLFLSGVLWTSEPWLFFALAPFTLPINVVLIAVMNAFALIYPSRQMFAAPGDFQVMGRQILLALAQLLLLLLGALCATAFGALGYYATGSWVVTLSIAWLTLVAEAVFTIAIVARAFADYDPSALDSA